ncbi:hypothetical protein TWF694_007302 [Orbilia ellipsospora]|uniref:Uncharacterized protein n=1 Tax=Orbilia ellipsospora TaxID=2528407 RepID=A0AAV9XHB0_9PEZI
MPKQTKLSLILLWYLLTSVIATSLPEAENALDRTHYGLRARDILDYIYGERGPHKRGVGDNESPCHYYTDETEPSLCKYGVPVSEYNNAIRKLHKKHKRRDIQDIGPLVYSHAPALTTRSNLFSEKRDESGLNLPANFTYVATHCYNSGVWAKDSEFISIQGKFCNSLNDWQNSGLIGVMVFFKGVNNTASTDGINPEDGILRDEKGNPIEIEAEFFADKSPFASSLASNNANSLTAACMEATTKLIRNSCQGHNDDMQGGFIQLIYDKGGDNVHLGFRMDPNAQWSFQYQTGN